MCAVLATLKQAEQEPAPDVRLADKIASTHLVAQAWQNANIEGSQATVLYHGPPHAQKGQGAGDGAGRPVSPGQRHLHARLDAVTGHAGDAGRCA